MPVPNNLAIDHVDNVFGDVFGVVRDSLDVPRGGEAVQGGDNRFRIAGHQALQFLDDGQVVIVNDFVSDRDLFRQRAVGVHKRIECHANH